MVTKNALASATRLSWVSVLGGQLSAKRSSLCRDGLAFPADVPAGADDLSALSRFRLKRAALPVLSGGPMEFGVHNGPCTPCRCTSKTVSLNSPPGLAAS